MGDAMMKWKNQRKDREVLENREAEGEEEEQQEGAAAGKVTEDTRKKKNYLFLSIYTRARHDNKASAACLLLLSPERQEDEWPSWQAAAPEHSLGDVRSKHFKGQFIILIFIYASGRGDRSAH